MASILTERLDSIPRKPLAMRGEGLRKKVADPAVAALVGQVVDRAIQHARLTRQEAAYRMGFIDATSVSRWISGVEPPQLLRMLAVPALRCGLSVALAEISEGAEVRTIVTFTYPHEAIK